MKPAAIAPPRFRHRSLAEYIGIVPVVALVVSSVANTAPATYSLQRGIAHLFAPLGFLMRMVPPDPSRADHIAWKLLETLPSRPTGCRRIRSCGWPRAS